MTAKAKFDQIFSIKENQIACGVLAISATEEIKKNRRITWLSCITQFNGHVPGAMIIRGANLTRFWTNYKRPRIATILSSF